MKRKLWQDWVPLVPGVRLFPLPWIGFGEARSAAWNSWIFGVLIAAFATPALALPRSLPLGSSSPPWH